MTIFHFLLFCIGLFLVKFSFPFSIVLYWIIFRSLYTKLQTLLCFSGRSFVLQSSAQPCQRHGVSVLSACCSSVLGCCGINRRQTEPWFESFLPQWRCGVELLFHLLTSASSAAIFLYSIYCSSLTLEHNDHPRLADLERDEHQKCPSDSGNCWLSVLADLETPRWVTVSPQPIVERVRPRQLLTDIIMWSFFAKIFVSTWCF